MKKISCILAIVLSAVLPTLLYSQPATQDLPKLPDDPRAKSGTLTNGLSYIIIKNLAQKNTATFCVAQKVGTSLEKGADRGSFMLLQQLATKGTRNFEGSAITDYLKSLGLGPDNIVFSTGADRITYAIKDVPIERANTIDSSLLILYNWMSSINVDESDIAPERFTLAQRILGSWTPMHRMETDLLSRLYPDSPYTGEIRPSEIRKAYTINSKDLRSFYYNWCRPELQCVIVVGDVDPAKMETQITSVFSTIPKPLKSTKRTWYEPKPFEGVKTFVLQDDEFEKCLVSINLLKQPLKDKYRKTNLPYIQDFMDKAALGLLQDRINEGILKENLPIYSLSIAKDKFMGIEKSSGINITFETLPSSVYAATSFVSAQIKKLADYGIDSREFSKASDVYWKALEAFYDNRSTAGNDVYLDRALQSYYDGYSLASTEMQFEIMKEVLFSLNNKKLSEYTSAAFAQDSNIVISCFMPKAAGVGQISTDRLLSAFAKPLDKPLLSGESSLPVWPQAVPSLVSDVVSETEDVKYGTKTIVLSNGATLIFKDLPQASDTLFFKAVSKGGYSLIKGASMGNQEFYNGVLDVSAISDVSYANMSRLYSYNHLGLSSKIGQNTEQMDGFAIPSSAEKLMQAVYLNMTDIRQDPAAFDIYTKKVLYDLKYNTLSPQTVFRDTVDYYRNSNKQFVRRITEDEVSSADYASIHKTLAGRFSNAADFTFIFAGKNASEYKDLAIKYIGGIPGNKNTRENWIVVPNYLAKGHKEKRFLVKMNVPRSYAGITLSCAKGLSSKNFVLSKMLENYASSIFRNELYTNVPLYNVKSSLDYYPEQIYALDLVFETDSASVHSCIESFVNRLSSCSRGEIQDKDFETLKKQVKDLYGAASATPGYWLELLQIKQMSSKDLSTVGEALDGITKKDFCAFVKDVLSGNRITIIMDGTTADIPTLQLLQENEFIKNFFDVD
ncbi:MAG: insulinase family protein [Bacteroidales bacterium]|nr:insulinase family protein [Bacteroidales bacterium]